MPFIFKNNLMFLGIYVWLFFNQLRLGVQSLSRFSLALLGSEGYWPSSSLSTYTEEDLVFRMMMDNHKRAPGIQVHSTTTTRRGEILANEPGRWCILTV